MTPVVKISGDGIGPEVMEATCAVIRAAGARIHWIDAPAGLDAVTMGYGVGNWHFYNGQRDQAMAIFRRIVDEQPAQWAAFGYIAAEAELAR